MAWALLGQNLPSRLSSAWVPGSGRWGKLSAGVSLESMAASPCLEASVFRSVK